MDDAARVRAVSVPLRRVLRWLLAIAGTVIAGWLLGGVAHADEPPAGPTVVEEASPVLGRVVHEVVQPRVPVRVESPVRVLPPVRVAPPMPPAAAKAPPPQREHAVPVQDVPARVRGPEAAVPPVRGPRAPLMRHPRSAAASKGGVAPRAGAVQRKAVPVHPAAPAAPAQAPAPAAPDQHSKAGGLVMPGGPVGLPGMLPWALTRPPASPARVPGPAAPVVRTAADEPSFAPD